MPRYNSHSLQLTDAEEKDFQEIRTRTGFGVKKIFMAMIAALKETTPEPKVYVSGIAVETEEEY